MTMSDAEARYRATLPVNAFETSEAGRAHLAALQAELVERGRPYGLSAAQVTAADRCGMALDEYSLMGAARTEADYRRIRDELAERRKVATEAAHELAVEAAKRAVKT